jgi:hypothetical protein
MDQGQLPQHCLTAGSNFQQHAATVFFVLLLSDQTASREAVREFDGTVMPDMQPFGYFIHRRLSLVGNSLESEQELVLLRIQSGRSRRLLTEMKKPTNLVSELSQRMVFVGSQIWFCHDRILSCDAFDED